MDWLPQPWDAIALIGIVAVAGYVIERLFVAWMMRLVPKPEQAAAARAEPQGEGDG